MYTLHIENAQCPMYIHRAQSLKMLIPCTYNQGKDRMECRL